MCHEQQETKRLSGETEWLMSGDSWFHDRGNLYRAPQRTRRAGIFAEDLF